MSQQSLRVAPYVSSTHTTQTITILTKFHNLDQVSQFRPSFKILTKFHNLSQVLHFRPSFTISANLDNFGQVSRFWPIFTIWTKFHNSDQFSRFWLHRPRIRLSLMIQPKSNTYEQNRFPRISFYIASQSNHPAVLNRVCCAPQTLKMFDPSSLLPCLSRSPTLWLLLVAGGAGSGGSSAGSRLDSPSFFRCNPPALLHSHTSVMPLNSPFFLPRLIGICGTL